MKPVRISSRSTWRFPVEGCLNLGEIKCKILDSRPNEMKVEPIQGNGKDDTIVKIEKQPS